MRFWDSSALVPLLAKEPRTREVQAALVRDGEVIVWWATRVECASAVARLEREGVLTASGMATCLQRLDEVAAAWAEVMPCDEIRETARRLLLTYPLRAADALQLGAAWLAAERRPASMTFATFDDRLRDAARREGFAIETFGAE